MPIGPRLLPNSGTPAATFSRKWVASPVFYFIWRFLISRKIPWYRTKITVLGTYRRKPVDFRARIHPTLNIVAFFKGYNSVFFQAQTPMVSMCSIRSPCRFGDFHFTPNGAHARHGSLCGKKSRVVALEKRYNILV